MPGGTDGTYYNNFLDRNVTVTWDYGKTFEYYSNNYYMAFEYFLDSEKIDVKVQKYTLIRLLTEIGGLLGSLL